MLINFTITERTAGFVETTAKKGEQVQVITRELLGPTDENLMSRLDQLHSGLFSKIPNLPYPPRISDLVITIDKDLNCTAYIDQLELISKVRATRSIEAGEVLTVKDISSIESVSLGIEIPESVAVVIVRSFYWKRSLFYDFGPLHDDIGNRSYNLEKTLGKQMSLLIGLPASPASLLTGESRLQTMKDQLDHLETLLAEKCADESKYQELLATAPWMLGATYSSLARHTKLDDEAIPDFTMIRGHDKYHDIIELKRPFLRLFKKDGSFASAFNDAWNQTERYLSFCRQQKSYLSEHKQLQFENPRCILLIGHNLNEKESAAIRNKQSFNSLITIMSYDQLLQHARHVFDLLAAVSDRSYPGDIEFSQDQ